jgi:predicted hotdog family 3-hydroxylacyl-ACP dehydratase
MLRLGVSYRVEELVPHRGAMSLLDSIDEYGEDWLRASLTTRPASAFANAHGVPGWVGIEYMAQAAAAFAGIERAQRGQPASIGLLIGSRYYRWMAGATFENIPFGTKLIVEARLALRDEQDFAAYDCALNAHGQRIAECTLKAYRPQDIRPYLPQPEDAGG